MKQNKRAHLRSKIHFLSLIFLLLAGAGCQSTIPVRPSTVSTADSFFKACSVGDVAKVQGLLNTGVDVNLRDEEGETPLMYAAVEGKTDVVKLLLDRGADLNAESSNRETALARAVGMSRYETVALLLDRGADIERSTDGEGPPLIYAAGGGDVTMIRLLLERGANINGLDTEGDSALMAAIRRNAPIDTVQLLLSAGANVNVRNRRGETPLLIAEQNGNESITALLRKTPSRHLSSAGYRGHERVYAFSHHGFGSTERQQ